MAGISAQGGHPTQVAQVQVVGRLRPVADHHIHLRLHRLGAAVGISRPGVDFGAATRCGRLVVLHTRGGGVGDGVENILTISPSICCANAPLQSWRAGMLNNPDKP